MNIRQKLLEMRDWVEVERDVHRFRDFSLVAVEESLLELDGFDFDADFVVFASRHRSKDERRMLTVHFTGNVAEAEYGGRPGELAPAASQFSRTLLRSIARLARGEDFEVTLECTHHGPTSLQTPSVFVEIGSTPVEWTDRTAGSIVATSILLLPPERDAPVGVGFGGNHYAPRQTRLVCETGVTFGHIFPSYRLDDLDKGLVSQALEKSRADFVYFDRKAMKADQRKRIEGMVNQLGYEVLKEGDLRAMDGVSWEFCRHIREKAREVCPSSRPVISPAMKGELMCRECCPTIRVTRIDSALLEEAEKLDRKRLETLLSDLNTAYLEYENGRFANILIGVDHNCARLAAENLTQECINILKEHYQLKYDGETLYLEEQQFNPQRARELDIPPGPLYGKLARGETIEIEGRKITPDMVMEKKVREIKVKNLPRGIL